MAYQVIKTIKGRKYLYQQESYREGSRVRTRCVCLGSIDPVTGELHERNHVQRATTQTVSEVIEATAEEPSPTPPPREESSPDRNPEVNTTTPRKSIPQESLRLLKIKANFDRKSLSPENLHLSHRAFLTRMENKGLSLDSLPTVSIRDGLKASTKYNARKNQVTVTLAHRNKHRSVLRRECFRGFGRATLESMKKEQPERFRELTLQMEISFQKTQKLITRFVMLGRDRNRFAKTLSLRFWGNVLQLKRNLLDPERIGLVDDSRRRDWQDELVSIYAAIEQAGATRFFADRKQHFDHSKAEVIAATNALKKLSRMNPKRRSAKRRLERAKFRFAAQEELMKKIRLVEATFF